MKLATLMTLDYSLGVSLILWEFVVKSHILLWKPLQILNQLLCCYSLILLWSTLHDIVVDFCEDVLILFWTLCLHWLLSYIFNEWTSSSTWVCKREKGKGSKINILGWITDNQYEKDLSTLCPSYVMHCKCTYFKTFIW